MEKGRLFELRSLLKISDERHKNGSKAYRKINIFAEITGNVCGVLYNPPNAANDSD